MVRDNPGSQGVVVGFAGLTTMLIALPFLSDAKLASAPSAFRTGTHGSAHALAVGLRLVEVSLPYLLLFTVLVIAYSAVVMRVGRVSVPRRRPTARPRAPVPETSADREVVTAPAPAPVRKAASVPPQPSMPWGDDRLRFRSAYRAVAGRRAEARYEVSRSRKARELEDARRGQEELALMLGESGCRYLMNVAVPTAIGPLTADAVALVGTTIVTITTLHLKGTLTEAGLGERWEHEEMPGDHQMLPNPISHLLRVSAAVTALVGDPIAVQRLVVLTGPAKAVACGREVVRLAALKARLAQIAKEDGGVGASAARSRFAFLQRAMGR